MISCSDSEPQMPVRDAHRLRRDTDVRHEGDRQSGADGDAIDRGDYRLVEIDHVVNDIAGFLHRLADIIRARRHLRDHVEIAAGPKRASGAGYDPDSGFG